MEMAETQAVLAIGETSGGRKAAHWAALGKGMPWAGLPG